MSGGWFDYAYFDAETLADTVEEMQDHAIEYDYPEETVEELAELESELRDKRDLLRAVEWTASGDWGVGKLAESIEEADQETAEQADLSRGEWE